MRRWWTFLLLAAIGGAAHAADRDFCPDRPGRASPPCTVSPGVLQVEASAFDWSHSRDADTVQDQYVTADLLARYGIADHAEVRVGWTALGFLRTRDRHSGAVSHSSSTGDVNVSLRRNLLNPGGGDTAIAVQPYVSIPTGGDAIGAGAWGAGILVPFAQQLAGGWSLAAVPEVDAAPDSDGGGRHLAYSFVTGLSHSLGKKLSLGGEVYAERDLDPAGHQTLASIDGTAAYALPGGNSQIDLQANAGLTTATPRIEIILGFAIRL